RVDHMVLIRIRHLRIERNGDTTVLCVLTLGKPSTGLGRTAARPGRAAVPVLRRVRRLSVRVRHAPTGRHAHIEHRLHDRALVTPVRETYAVGLPVGAIPDGLGGHAEPWDGGQEAVVAGGPR